MTRYKLIVQYDGSNYAGFQVQPNRRTIQGEIERVLAIMTKGEAIRIYGSGRTDAGVHALGQVIHFDYPKTLPADAMKRALNALLPADIVIRESAIVANDFHARYDARAKTYHYYINNKNERDPFMRNYSLWHPYSLDGEKMSEALTYIEGEHDFTSFSSTKDDKTNKVRQLYTASCQYDAKRSLYILSFTANGFLYNQVRICVGTLLEIGDERRPVEDMESILLAKDRQLAGPTAAAQGLFLTKVYY